MKRTAFKIASLCVLLSGTACKKYLDINNNPNAATSASAQNIMPQALAATASVLNNYNNYGSQLVGYMANAGGYGGFGSSVTYNFSSADFSGLWSGTYDNLEDYQTVINQTNSQLPEYGYYNAAARIMRAMDFQLLVDAYNDIPYTDALKGEGSLTPTYTAATTIYADLARQLDSAIAIINRTDTASGEIKNMGSVDILFGGDATLWKQFANTLKLRLLVKAGDKVTFDNKTFDAAGFLKEDALINPGYTRDNGRQNPQWNNWAYTYTGGAATRSWMPTDWALSFYDGTKLDDPRGYVVYRSFPSTPSNQLGYENSSVSSSPAGSAWFSYVNSDANSTSTSGGNSIGVLKGPNAGFPVMLAAESYFLQAEAAVKGITTGTASTLFDAGILASFNYLYQLPNGSYSTDPNWSSPSGDYQYYKQTNSTNYLANFALANTTAKQLEAIITQKYIALNFINAQEAWNDYRRTHYPAIVEGSTSSTASFASLQSVSSRTDKLPSRILYPTAETSYNPQNVPKNISPFTSYIFWALQ